MPNLMIYEDAAAQQQRLAGVLAISPTGAFQFRAELGSPQADRLARVIAGVDKMPALPLRYREGLPVPGEDVVPLRLRDAVRSDPEFAWAVSSYLLSQHGFRSEVQDEDLAMEPYE